MVVRRNMKEEDMLYDIKNAMDHVTVNGCNPTHIMIHPQTLKELMNYYAVIGDCECTHITRLLGLIVIEDPDIDPGKAKIIDMTELIVKDINEIANGL